MKNQLAGNLFNPAINPRIGRIGSSEEGVGILQILVQNLINVAFGISGLILLVMLLWGAYRYITSGGDKEATQAAFRRMTNAMIGICILFSVYALIRVVETIFGVGITVINIPTAAQP